jgi:hypothetical protein
MQNWDPGIYWPNPNYVEPVSQSLPPQTQPVYCTDEDILARAGGDFVALCPAWQSMARGVDGSFAAGSPWVLSSASVDFGAQGVAPNQVVLLSAPKSQYPGLGDLLAIDAVSGGSLVLRRVYKDLNDGQPPAPAAGLSPVSFTISTLDPQSATASRDLKSRFGIDERIFGRNSCWIYSLHDLRDAAVFSVLLDRYMIECRSERGDFQVKVVRIRQLLDDVLGRLQVRWGPYGNSAVPATLFNCKVSR